TPQSAWIWLILLSTGFWGGFGHWLLILAHERAPAPILAPFGYVNIVYVIALGYVVFSDVPGWWTLAGAATIIASGVYLLYRERQKVWSAAPAASATVSEG
ncbi:MAG TPA: EamA family transporter, partial [Hyphomicrobiales bacterium]|nr:EamA family transporter [Hyphomicrobiales bacterium]